MQKIVNREEKSSGGMFESKEDLKTLEFYKHVKQAHSIRDLETWVEAKNYKTSNLDKVPAP